MNRENRAGRHRSLPISHDAVKFLAFFAHQWDPHSATWCKLIQEFLVNLNLSSGWSWQSNSTCTLRLRDTLRNLLHQILKLSLLSIYQILNGRRFRIYGILSRRGWGCLHRCFFRLLGLFWCIILFLFFLFTVFLNLGQLASDMNHIILHLFTLVGWKSLSSILSNEMNFVFSQEMWTNLLDVAFCEIIYLFNMINWVDFCMLRADMCHASCDIARPCTYI